jgi:F420-dependent oxidoreductase-like protein
MLPRLPVGTFIAVGCSLEKAIDRVRLAEELGYDSAYVTHIAGRDSPAVAQAYAARTERIRVGTGVMPIFTRHPVASAQAAATIDEFSHGRFVLGIGVSHQPTVEGWYSHKLDKPVALMREYVDTVRTILRGEEPPEGARWPTQFRFMGYEPRPDIPVYIAALSPAMLRLAGDRGDGVILWLCNPDYIRDVVIPEVTKGRERAGKGIEGFDVVAAVPAAVTDDAPSARARMRADLIPYFSLPFYRAMLERSGFGDDIAGFDEGMQKGDQEGALASISDDFLKTLTAMGTEEAATATIERYRDAGATSPCLGGVPGTDFDATLRALSSVAGR